MMFRFLLVACLLGACIADLRSASQPKKAWKVIQENGNVPFVTQVNKGYAYYMEPSAFNYQGLAQQRANAYDNFLRSNIDNEQDKRNFVTEAGKDHLPFRSYEGAMTSQASGGTVQTKLPAGTALEATPGVPFNHPLRWNNPHAAELEVNIWILNNQAVVPILKPTCSGEGHKNNVYEFTIPADFAQLSEKVKGFTGCNKVGDCTLQVYAHSVETRQYAIGVPLIVKATMAPEGPNAKAPAALPEPQQDPALDLSQLRDLCLPRNDPSARYTSAVPQKPRLVSDVYNHAYQNSDYSPYSGQQPNLISKNLQAAVILKMVTGNRGELGKSLLTAAQKQVQQKIEAQGQQVIKRLEGQTNNVINNLLQNQAKAQDTTTMTNGQTSANCFLCPEKGATNTRRLNTNTYVPSFQIPAALVGQARNLVEKEYRNNLIDADGTLQIYTTALKLMQPALIKAADAGLGYLGPRIKTENLATLADTTDFKKRTANGGKDQGQYATAQAYAKADASNIGNKANIKVTATSIVWGVQNIVNPSAPTAAPAPTIAPGLFSLLNNTDKACRGATAADNLESYYTKVPATGVNDCQAKCIANNLCKAIEFLNGRCEIWNITPQATKEYTGATCMLRKPAARQAVPATPLFDQLAERLANGDEKTLPPDAEKDSDSQLDPNGWGTDSTCDETQSDSNPLDDKECLMPAPLFTGVDADGTLLYEAQQSIPQSAATSLGAPWVLVVAAVMAVVQGLY